MSPPRFAISLILILILSGCASFTSGAGMNKSREEADGREAASAVAMAVSISNSADIDEWARRVVQSSEYTTSRFVLVAISAREARDYVDPLGELVFMYTPTTINGGPLGSDERASPFCYEVPFSFYGALIEPSGQARITTVECPTPPVAITPPPDTTVRAVIAPNARDVASDILSSLASISASSARGIEQLISAQLTPPDDAFEINAEPRVMIDGQNIGISIGGPDDCVLFARIDGIVREVFVARIRLQPGELGCTPATALTDPTELRPPH